MDKQEAIYQLESTILCAKRDMYDKNKYVYPKYAELEIQACEIAIEELKKNL